MDIQILPPSRYPELLANPLFQGHPLNPDTSIVVYRPKADGSIGSFWIAQAVIHVEPVYIDPEQQDGGLTAINLLREVLCQLAAKGEKTFFAFAPCDTDQSVVDYLLRLGLQPLPWATFVGQIPTFKEPI